jgi:hypothetical protein
MKKLLSLGAVVALILGFMVVLGTPAQAASACTNLAAVKLGWGAPVLADEFNYTGKPLSERWGMYNSPGHQGKGLRSPSAWNVNGSAAVVTGQPNGTTGGMAMKGSGRTYGKYEVCIRVNDRDPKYHPVALLWPSDRAHYNAKCWEIDFAEGMGNTEKMNFFNHYGCPTKQSYASKTVDLRGWHAFALNWSPEGVVGYIDGVEWFRDTAPSHISNVKMFLALQLDWFPKSGESTKTSQMFIDHARVYAAGAPAPKPSPPPTCPV